MTEKKTILTGIKPTGNPHIGNLYGAIMPVIKMAENKDYNSYIFIADIHALNKIKDSEVLKNNTYAIAATFLAFGLDAEKSIFYKQSDITEIFEITSILMNYTSKGLMNRAHAYKAIIDKDKNDDKVNMGLYTYPVLMAADILSMNANFVPVGQDQKQHIEIARDIACSFNAIYKTNCLIEPEPMIENNNTIMGLDGRKMSKSYNNTIELFSSAEDTKKKIMKIPTDTKDVAEPKDSTSLLYQLMAFFKVDKEFCNKFLLGGIGYGEAKKMLSETINNFLSPYREKYNEIIKDTKTIDKYLEQGSEIAHQTATKTLKEIKKIIGLV